MVKQSRGFSLIELTVVLCLLVVITSLTMANVSWLNQLLIRSEIDKLRTITLYLQRSAQMSNEQQQLTFNEEGRSYTFDGYQEKLPAQVRFGIAPGVKGPPSKPEKTPGSAITFKNKAITFSPEGIIQSGTVYLTDARGQYVYALSSPIAQFSYVRTYRHDVSRWHLLK